MSYGLLTKGVIVESYVSSSGSTGTTVVTIVENQTFGIPPIVPLNNAPPIIRNGKIVIDRENEAISLIGSAISKIHYLADNSVDNSQTTQEIFTNINKQLIDLRTELDGVRTYDQELEIIQQLNSSLSRVSALNSGINTTARNLQLSSKFVQLNSGIEELIQAELLNSVSNNFDTITNKIDSQNEIENNRFQLMESELNTIGLENIRIYLLSKDNIIEIPSGNLSIKNGIYQLNLGTDTLSAVSYGILYFQNSNYLVTDVPITKILSVNDTIDLIAINRLNLVDGTNYIGNKLYIKMNGNIVYESFIFEQEDRLEYTILYVSKTNGIDYSKATIDIIVHEIDEFVIPFQSNNSDIDTIQDLLIGKRIYEKISGKSTYYDENNNIIKIVRTYLTPDQNTETRVPSDI